MTHKLQYYITFGLFAAFTVWWAVLLTSYAADLDKRQIFAAVYGIMALWGGILGLIHARAWGGWKSNLGKALILFSLGLLFQEFGQLSYSYFIYYQHIDIPYPSIGDIGYFGSVPLYIVAMYFLASVVGVKFSLKSFLSKIFSLLIPAFVLIVSWANFLRGYNFEGTPALVVFLDYGYPLGQAIYVSLAVLVYALSTKSLGGVLRRPLQLLMFALVVQYAADYMFLHQTINETWVVGGINDYTYLLSYTVMTVALIKIYQSFESIKTAA